MEEKTSLLICLGAATAANCIPCFAHYQKKASAAGLTPEEIMEAVELAGRVKSGAQMVMRQSINRFLGRETGSLNCGCAPASSQGCCDS